MRDSPRSPTAKTNGSRFEGNRIINPHARIPKSTNKQTNSRERSDFRTMEEEQKVLISMPSENNCPRSSVLPFDANSPYFAR